MLIASAPASPSTLAQLFGSGLIGVREGLEAGIVVMILVAFLVKSGRRDGLRWVWLGVGAALAMVLGVFAVIHYGTSTVTGLTAEIIAGFSSMVAVAMVTGMVLWMRAASRTIAADLRRRMGHALGLGPVAVLALAFFAVGREGIETALLMVGYAENSAGSSWPLLGLLLGVLVAAALTAMLYFGAVRIDLALFFRWTGAALVVVAAGIFGYGIRALQIGGVLPGASTVAFDLSNVWDTSSWYGTLLSGLLNLRPDPTVLQLGGWVLYLVVVLPLFLRPARVRPVVAPVPA